MRDSWCDCYAVLTLDKDLLLFDTSSAQMQARGGLEPKKPALSFSCGPSVHAAWATTPPSSKLIVSAPAAGSPSSAVWAWLSKSGSSADTAKDRREEHALDFESDAAAAEFLKALTLCCGGGGASE